DPSSGGTAKERFASHAYGSCGDCHKRLDPIRFGFQNYNSSSRARAKDNGEGIDRTGSVFESDGPALKQAVELLKTRAESKDVQDCYVKHWLRFGYGRGETKADSCMIDKLDKAFDDKGGDIKELLVALTQTDAFLYRRAGGTP